MESFRLGIRKKRLVILAVMLAAMLILPISATQAASVTVATFADPSGNAADPLFTVNWTDSTVNGGWANSESNLLLQIPLTGGFFPDAWFEMDQLTITNTTIFGGAKFGETDAGQIRFYENGTNTDPVLLIDFAKGFIGKQFLGADELFYANNVTITGSAIPYALSDEQFNFSFANVTNIPDPDGGFTSTASFTSSAVVPEPVTLSLLGFGGLLFIKKRKKA